MFGLIAPTLSLGWHSGPWKHSPAAKRDASANSFKAPSRAMYRPRWSPANPRSQQNVVEGERRVMTYVFTDIADFTTMSELLEFMNWHAC